MKLAMSESGKASYELALEILGPLAPVTEPRLAEATSRFVLGFFTQFANTIAGGSSEIQRNIIAQRVLGLPRG
jgi:alkylation response protein AidB-like acyl-CoA dehydrogenase